MSIKVMIMSVSEANRLYPLSGTEVEGCKEASQGVSVRCSPPHYYDLFAPGQFLAVLYMTAAFDFAHLAPTNGAVEADTSTL
jgi:hypothetical protein